MGEPIRIAMWSGPRNISTAMMRSFGARADCAVSDEPFYGAFLKDSGEPHPMAEEIIADMDCDWRSVLATQSGAIPSGKTVWYQKHMPHHMVGPISLADMPEHRHAFLIRSPERVVASYRKKNELADPEALGFARLRQYFEFERQRTGRAPPVVDSDDILTDAAGVLTRLCHSLGIPWDEAMQSWEAGPHPEDGIWGVHWYDKVNKSNGFGAPPESMPELTGEYRAIAEACRADYEALKVFAL
ncbi:HAD family hydrolase [Altererythrobacter arenosus]|uniref:HAD family hydrolase n=1 Tax=Altererythrobacter arenosus TaxID=3032592 RepID=A0ABY8FUJ4_9SPHN|nr:HAD family hydrolase [Altererythrobacter sp. CAU 1644]WFL77071.1 HAD family hydrolase [Altererythrobacter sp. CAU 1644]